MICLSRSVKNGFKYDQPVPINTEDETFNEQSGYHTQTHIKRQDY
jgi:hypothetical protein